MEITRSVPATAVAASVRGPDGQGNSDGGRGRLRIAGTSRVANENVDVTGPPSSCTAATAAAEVPPPPRMAAWGCGCDARVADRFHYAGNIGVVTHPTDLSAVVLENHRVDNAQMAPAPRTSSTSLTMADFSGMVTERPHQASSPRSESMKEGSRSTVTSMAEYSISTPNLA